MNTNERIKELETKLEKMHDQIQGIDADIMIFEGELKKLKSQPKEQWNPVGGVYGILDTGAVIRRGYSSQSTRNFGTERPTREQAEKARDAMRVFNRLLAYRDEFAPNYEPVWDGNTDHYYVYFNERSKKWDIFSNHEARHPTVVYMPKDVAEELARKLNDGEVVL